MSDTTRIAAYWRERTILDYELADRAQMVDLRITDRPEFELIREINPLEAARLTREAAAHRREGLLNG